MTSDPNLNGSINLYHQIMMEGRFEDDQAASPFTSYFLDTEESNLPSFGEPPPSSRNISPSRGIMSSYQSPWGYGEPESGTDTSAGSLSDNASSLVPFQDHNHQSRKRRGHTKSRLGCISCKKRKIKCQETWPQCENCVKKGIRCEYPTIFNQKQHDRIVSEVLNARRPQMPLSPNPTEYTANDMRLFHHFITAAHLPVYESAWIRDVPAMSSEYQYLMHAILASAGAHANLLYGNTEPGTAVRHRQNAIQGLNEALARWPLQADEAHAMLATSYLLAFQSHFMPDGFADYILSMRGSFQLKDVLRAQQLRGVFELELEDPGQLTVYLRPQNFHVLNQKLLGDALLSLDAIFPMVDSPSTHDIEKAIYQKLVEAVRYVVLVPRMHNIPDTVETQTPDPVQAAAEICKIDCLLQSQEWPQKEVIHLLSPSNTLSQVIMSHYAALRFVLTPLCAPELGMGTHVKAMVEWCEIMLGNVKDDGQIRWTDHVQWPARVTRAMRRCVNENQHLTLGELFDTLVEDPQY